MNGNTLSRGAQPSEGVDLHGAQASDEAAETGSLGLTGVDGGTTGDPWEYNKKDAIDEIMGASEEAAKRTIEDFEVRRALNLDPETADEDVQAAQAANIARWAKGLNLSPDATAEEVADAGLADYMANWEQALRLDFKNSEEDIRKRLKNEMIKFARAVGLDPEATIAKFGEKNPDDGTDKPDTRSGPLTDEELQDWLDEDDESRDLTDEQIAAWVAADREKNSPEAAETRRKAYVEELFTKWESLQDSRQKLDGLNEKLKLLQEKLAKGEEISPGKEISPKELAEAIPPSRSDYRALVLDSNHSLPPEADMDLAGKIQFEESLGLKDAMLSAIKDLKNAGRLADAALLKARANKAGFNIPNPQKEKEGNDAALEEWGKEFDEAA